MVSRLRRKASNDFIYEVRQEVLEDIENENTSNMDLLNELDETMRS